MNIIVIGGGKIGYYLVKTLLDHGHDPKLVEIDKNVCKFLANSLDIPVICGDGTLIEVLENISIQDADAMVSVTGQDETNLISCQLAKKVFKIKKTIAKVNNPKNAQVMEKLGIDIAISSTDNIAKLLERELDSNTIKELISIKNGDSSVSEINLPEKSPLHGKKLSEIKLPDECIIISILRDDKVIIPRGNIKLFSLDKVMILAKNKFLPQIKTILKLN